MNHKTYGGGVPIHGKKLAMGGFRHGFLGAEGGDIHEEPRISQ